MSDFLIDFVLVFCAISIAGLIGYLIAQETIETAPLVCNTYNEYNVTNEQTYFKNITENRTYSNNYEKYMVYYPRTERECGRKAELRTNVFFNQGEGNTIHAVIGMYPDYLITAGYNNLYDDGRVYPDEIKYRWCFKK